MADPALQHLENKRMREVSGNVKTEDNLAKFLYILARNELPIGRIESVIDELLFGVNSNEAVFTNGWLAQWAMDAAGRLDEPY